jgi:hypothetical protein
MKEGLEVHMILLYKEYVRINFKQVPTLFPRQELRQLFERQGQVLEFRIHETLSSLT